MATYTDLATRVLRYLVDRPQILNDELPLLVQGAQRRLEDLGAFKALEAELGAITVVGQRKLCDKPADWNAVREDPYWVDGTGKDDLFDLLTNDGDLRKRYNANDPLQKGQPTFLYERLTSFDVYPLPSSDCPKGALFSDGNWRVFIPYWKRLADVTVVGTASNWFTENAFDLMTWEVIAGGFDLLKDEFRNTNWMLKARGERKRLLDAELMGQLPRDLTMGYRLGAANPSPTNRGTRSHRGRWL